MIVSTRPLVDCCPVLPAAMEGRQLCQWDKDSCADAGFLKIDLLGLGMLSAVERCVEDIARTRHERIDLSRIPFDDAATYTAIQAADTMGVFQIESRAQMASLRRTRPETLDDLTIQVAIVRPGPILGGAVNPYIARRQQLREDPDYVVPYDHPSLEPVLRDTLGTIIFQDQVLEVAIAFAGFSPGEAEGLRRAMSRKRSEAAIEAYHRRFVEGAARTHEVDSGGGGAGLRDDHGVLGLRLPEGPRRGLRAARLPVDVAAGALRPGVPVRAAQRAADGLLCVGHAGPRGAAARDRAAAGRRQRERGDLHDRRHRASASASATSAACAPTRSPRWRRRARPAGPSARSATSPRAPGRGGRRSRSWPGRARATRCAPSASRREVLWELGVAAPGEPVQDGTQLSLPLDLPGRPGAALARAVGGDDRRLRHHRADARGPPDGAPAPAAARRHGVLPRPRGARAQARVRIGGLVVARQRPGTAKGIVFLLLEDEFGTINLIVPPPVYERHRLLVRSEPLMLAEGRLEKLARRGAGSTCSSRTCSR